MIHAICYSKKIDSIQQEETTEEARFDAPLLAKMPDNILATIVSWIPIVTPSLKNALYSFKALKIVNKNFIVSLQKEQIVGAFVHGLIEKHKHEDIEKESFKNGLNLSNKVLEIAFKNYIKRENIFNKLNKIADLNRSIKEISNSIFKSANKLFGKEYSIKYKVIHNEVTNPHFIDLNRFFIKFNHERIEILMPFQYVEIKSNYIKKPSAGIRLSYPSISIAEVLIARLGAIFYFVNDLNSEQTFYEVVNISPFYDQIREIEPEDLNKISYEDTNNAKGSKKIIVSFPNIDNPDSDWPYSMYKITKIEDNFLDLSEENYFDYFYSYSTFSAICSILRR